MTSKDLTFMKWTPISESLPPELDYEEEYYVTIGGRWLPFTTRGFYSNKQWKFHNDDGIIDHQSYGWEILAWMKTNDPEPWKG